MTHSPSFTLEPHETEALLERLKEWRFGIRPNGTLANEACFVLGQRPSVVVVPESANPLTTYIVTRSKWTCNLANIGVISRLDEDDNDAILQTLADSYMIFKPFFQSRIKESNRVHAIRIQNYATINIDNILRPTENMAKSIEGVIGEPNEEARWSRLLGFWDNYGYFWPRRIILGFREHFSEDNKSEYANNYHSIRLVLEERMNKAQSRKDPYDLHDFMNNSVIAARSNISPLHELLPTYYREKVIEIIQQRFTQIPVGRYVRIYNPVSDSYLAWSPRHSQDKYGDNFVIRPLSKDNLLLKSDKQYLWQLAWNYMAFNTYNTANQEPYIEHQPSTVRGSSSIYIYPSCRTKLSKRNSIYLGDDDTSVSDRTIQVDTHKMLLTCQPYQMDAESSEDPKVNIRPLRLRRPEELLNENEMKWVIEYPENKLKYAADQDIWIKLNVDEHIHKLKPLVQGDNIQLRQIGLLTAFNTHFSQTTQESYVQSLRRVRRLPQLEESKSKSRKAFMCVDEKDTFNGFATHSHWTIELATEQDLERHLDNLKIRDDQIILESRTSSESSMLPPDHSILIPNSSSSSSINEVYLKKEEENRAQYFENLAKVSTSKLLYGFLKKVTLDPLAQIIVPSSRNKTENMD